MCIFFFFLLLLVPLPVRNGGEEEMLKYSVPSFDAVCGGHVLYGPYYSLRPSLGRAWPSSSVSFVLFFSPSRRSEVVQPRCHDRRGEGNGKSRQQPTCLGFSFFRSFLFRWLHRHLIGRAASRWLEKVRLVFSLASRLMMSGQSIAER